MRRAVRCAALALGWCGLATSAPAADLTVGAGASVDLGTGRLDLGCANVNVEGTLSAGSVGFSAARDLSISPAGAINGNAATLQVAGNWDNAGTFNAGNSSVQLVDGCGRTTVDLSGSNTFASLKLITAAGKVFQFESGSTQTVTLALTRQGAMGNLLRLRSTVWGSEAFLNLLGGQSVSFVDVKDIHATGNTILVGPNSIVGINTSGWQAVPGVPSVGLLGEAALAFALLLIAGRALMGLRRTHA